MLVSEGMGTGYLGMDEKMSIAAKALDEARKDTRGFVRRITLQQISILGPSISSVRNRADLGWNVKVSYEKAENWVFVHFPHAEASE